MTITDFKETLGEALDVEVLRILTTDLEPAQTSEDLFYEYPVRGFKGTLITGDKKMFVWDMFSSTNEEDDWELVAEPI